MRTACDDTSPGGAADAALRGAALARTAVGEWTRVARAQDVPPSDAERVAARAACGGLLRSPHRGVAPQLAAALLDAASAFGRSAGATVRAAGGRVRAAPGAACGDAHPECRKWASATPSECEANPGYMLTRCRLSCGLCAPGLALDALPASVKDAIVRDGDGLAGAVVLNACLDAAPCGGGGGDKEGGGGGAAAAPNAASPSPSPSIAPYSGPLIGRCFVIPAGWWVYEVCVGVGVRQLHLPASPTDEPATHSLGTFVPPPPGGGGGGGPDVLRPGELYAGAPVDAPFPFLGHTYAGGDACNTGGGDASSTAAATTSPRSTHLRLACPHDGRTRALVSEPQPCSYAVTLFHTDVCAALGVNSARSDGDDDDDGSSSLVPLALPAASTHAPDDGEAGEADAVGDGEAEAVGGGRATPRDEL